MDQYALRSNDVFLLGAGFSKAVSSNMPLLNDLTKDVRARLPAISDSHPIFAHENNIEAWLTYLSKPQVWLKDHHNLENHSLLLQLTNAIAEAISSRTESIFSKSPEPPPWLRTLINHWHSCRSTIITFNYDTLIERAVEHFYVEPMPKTQDLYPVPFAHARSRRGTALFGSSFTGDTFRLLKLHGSVNWWYSGIQQVTGETLYCTTPPWKAHDSLKDDQLAFVKDKFPMIIPPTTDKTGYFQHESIRFIWRQAALAIQAAPSIYIMGYSLPESDLSVRSFLRTNYNTIPSKVTVVDKEQTVEGRYRELLNTHSVVQPGISGTDCVEEFVNRLVSKTLSAEA